MNRILASAVVLGCVACHRSDRTPPVTTLDLRATPAVAHPGSKVSLLPTFPVGGTAHIDPGVGSVVSGTSYEIGPLTADTTFTLTVKRDGISTSRSLLVPVGYRERISELTPSAIARTRAGSALLTGGLVLQVGGASPNPTFWANTEAYSLEREQFSPVGELSTGRAESTVVPLPNGGAMSFGGVISISNFQLSTLVEEWDPAQLAWSAQGNLRSTRFRHTATRCPDGRVLLAGGVATGGPVDRRDAELWVPGAGARSPANSMLRRRAAHTATPFPDGRVLLAGGYDLGTGDAIASCEWFDPATETFVPGPELREARFYHAAVPLDDGRLLVVGGERQGILMLTSAEVFDPTTGSFQPTGSMATARSEVRAVRLLTGHVLVAGGATEINATDSVEVWSPQTGVWREWGARLPERRTGHALHVLAEGRVLLLGGDSGNGWPSRTCWLID